MKASEFWKNFRLGEELHIAGGFIYNGLRRYHELRQLDHPDELFEFLYDLSVGLERLLKIAVVLCEHSDTTNQANLEQSLRTHRHLALLARLRKHELINFGQPQVELLVLLGAFYNSLRYDRFTLSSVYEGKKEVKSLCGLFEKHLNVSFPADTSLFGTMNEDRYRAFIFRTVLKITHRIYKIVRDRSSEIGLYTYELRHGSKAESVFLREVNIADEDILWKELLIFFMNTEPTNGYLKFLKGITPLDFDPGLTGDYLDCFKSNALKAGVMDELESLYENLESDKGQRIELMKAIATPGVWFDDGDD